MKYFKTMKNLLTIIINWFKAEEKTLDQRLEAAIKKFGFASSGFKAELLAIVSDIEEKANDKLQEYKIDIHNDVTDVLNGVKKEKTAVSVWIEKIVDDLNALKKKAGILEAQEIETLKAEFNARIIALSEMLKNKVIIK